MCAVDLHVHSTKSDGTYSPSQLIDYAIEKNLSAIALTDHDTVAGIDEALSYAREKAIKLIPGIELSSEYKGKDIHIVGLFIDHKNPIFTEHIKRFQEARDQRNIKMCELLRDGAGIDISYEALKEAAPDGTITRAHYGRFLYEQGYVKSIEEAFERYIGDHCKYFVPRKMITPGQAVELITEGGGLPVLAHPILYHMTKAQLDQLVASLKEVGLVAIEGLYSTYSSSDERHIKELATKYDLLISGGSDFHGKNKKDLDLGSGYGRLYIHDEILEKLENYINNR